MYSALKTHRMTFAILATLFIVLTPIAQPKVVLAKASTSTFTATGTLCLVGLPTIKAAMTRRGLLVNARGELLAGLIDSSTWSEIAGAGMEAVIAHEESLFNMATNTFEGKIEGKIKIVGSDEVMQGSMNGTVSGAFLPITDPADLLTSIYTSTANVKWNIRNKGSDSDDDDKSRAKGTATVTFVADVESGMYCGPIVLNGTYREKATRS